MNNQTMLSNIAEYKHIIENLIAPTRMENFEKLPDHKDYKEYDCEYDDEEIQALNFND